MVAEVFALIHWPCRFQPMAGLTRRWNRERGKGWGFLPLSLCLGEVFPVTLRQLETSEGVKQETSTQCSLLKDHYDCSAQNVLDLGKGFRRQSQ
jgi:hypothetical protein